MDIVVVRTDGSWYTRPDITLVRDADRFCLPGDCTGALAYKACCILSSSRLLIQLPLSMK